MNLPIDRIKPNPNQPRKFFDQNSLNELAMSIKSYGVMQPISVQMISGYNYELVAGERRLRASKLAGMVTIPAIIVNINEEDRAMLAIIENLQRQNLNYLEEAEGFQNIMADFNFTQEELAVKIGKSQSTVANKLRILKLPKDIQKRLIENELTERHARALLKLEDEQSQLYVLDRVIKNGLNVKKTEALIEEVLAKATNPASERVKVKQYIKDVRIFTNTVKEALGIMKDSGVESTYEVEEAEFGYDIRIELRYPNNDI